MKKVVSIQDISCVGKCSLTVALPIISAMAWLNANYQLAADASYHGEHFWLYQRKS